MVSGDGEWGFCLCFWTDQNLFAVGFNGKVDMGNLSRTSNKAVCSTFDSFKMIGKGLSVLSTRNCKPAFHLIEGICCAWISEEKWDGEQFQELGQSFIFDFWLFKNNGKKL